MNKSETSICEPFFIIGSGRSGTSLLRRIINLHEDIAIPEETHYYNIFMPIRNLYEPIQSSRNVKLLIRDVLKTFHIRNWIPRLESEQVLSNVSVKSFGGVFEALMLTWLNIKKKKTWGEKTPQHIYFLDDMLNDFPNAKFIHVVRDGRDVALSYSNAKFGPKGFASSAYRWKKELGEVEKFKGKVDSDNLVEIRYEDLIEKPYTVLEEIGRLLGVSFDEIDFSKIGGHDSRYVEKTNKINLQSAKILDNAFKWKKSGDARSNLMFESIAENELSRYGYQLAFSANAYLNIDEIKKRLYTHDYPKKILSLLMHTDGMKYEFARNRIVIQRYIEKMLCRKSCDARR